MKIDGIEQSCKTCKHGVKDKWGITHPGRWEECVYCNLNPRRKRNRWAPRDKREASDETIVEEARD